MFLYFLVGAAIVGIPILLLFYVVSYFAEIDGIKDFISFKQFKSFYEINPNRWELRDCTVECRQSGYLVRNIRFKFHYIDYLKYARYKRAIDKNKKYASLTKDTQK